MDLINFRKGNHLRNGNLRRKTYQEMLSWFLPLASYCPPTLFCLLDKVNCHLIVFNFRELFKRTCKPSIPYLIFSQTFSQLNHTRVIKDILGYSYLMSCSGYCIFYSQIYLVDSTYFYWSDYKRYPSHASVIRTGQTVLSVPLNVNARLFTQTNNVPLYQSRSLVKT